VSGAVEVEAGGLRYRLEPQAVRQSLSDEAPMLWGFEVNVVRDGERVGVKTCFVSRVTVQARHPEALAAGVDLLGPALWELGLAKVRERLEAGEAGDEILFA
jgi:hypothetical protein